MIAGVAIGVFILLLWRLVTWYNYYFWGAGYRPHIKPRPRRKPRPARAGRHVADSAWNAMRGKRGPYR